MAITAHDPEFVERAIRCGVAAYLVKPVDGRQVERALHLAVSRHAEFETMRTEVGRLQEALETRRLVERAKGILMDRAGLPEEEAFLKIQRRARDSNRTMADVARQIIDVAARRYVREVLHIQRVDEKVTGIVELLTSELVTNALLHAHGAGELALTITGDTVRVEVDDPSGLFPAPQRAGRDALGGRGLTIVAAFARAWGVEPKPQGKRVWFEVDRQPAGAGPQPRGSRVLREAQ